ncbi:hypothetical protein LXL04_004466 [Taraxacum kok-saghyz]
MADELPGLLGKFEAVFPTACANTILYTMLTIHAKESRQAAGEGKSGKKGPQDLAMSGVVAQPTLSPEPAMNGLFARRSDQRPRLGPRTRSVVCAFDSGRRTRTPDSVRRFASDSVRPKKSQTEFLPVISDSVRGLMSVRGVWFVF